MGRNWLKSAIAVLVLAIATAACGTSGSEDDDAAGSQNQTSRMAAAELRAGLTGLLTEHVYLAALATGAALRGDNDGFSTFAEALNGTSDSNTSQLVDAIRGVYGNDVGRAFDGLWRSNSHIPAVVAYTQAIAKNDTAGADTAVNDLLAYSKTVATTLNSVNSNLPIDGVEAGVKSHVTTLKAVIDAQKAGDQTKVYTSLREAYHHMSEFAASLADATARKFPDKIEGNPMSAASGLRTGLTSLLREHVLLAASATGGALRGDTKAFNAAASALNGPSRSNSADIVTAVRGVYGTEVGKAFDGLWRSNGHIPAVVAYTQAVAKDDTAGADKAVNDLLAYAKTFGTTMSSVNGNLSSDAVGQAITSHATTLKAVIDAQKAKQPTQVAKALREAVHHMSGTAKVLADATVAKFPEKFTA